MTVLRPHEEQDIEPAIGLISEVYREVLGRDIGKFIRSEVERILESFDARADLFLIAEHDGELVGSLVIEHNNPEEDCCNMQFLVVRPDHRGHGHGRELVTRGLEFAKQAGYKSIELNATRDFDFALRMYERMGFTHVDTYLWQGNDMLTFDKLL